MKISMNWISDYVDISNIDVSKLALSFTMSTAEIEEVTFMGKEIEPLPSSDLPKGPRISIVAEP